MRQPGRLAGLGLALVVLAGCVEAAPATPSASPSSPRVSPGASARIGLPVPGRPYDASDVLDAMHSSPRPGGVPDELETAEIAAQLADHIWTVDGRPWDAWTIGGSCSASACTLDVVGVRDGIEGEDVWTFGVIPEDDDAEVEVLAAELGVLPTGLKPSLDRLARRELPAAVLDGMILAGIRWLPPPDEPGLVLSYRTGDEEGSCEIEVLIDPRRADVTSYVPRDPRAC